MTTKLGQIIACMLWGYAVGNMNPSYLLGKIKGFDIRSRGSGNAGASNAIITMGKLAGLFCALFDILKAYLTVKISIRVFTLIKLAGIIAGTFCILGHIFPVLMHFQGGKGLAALGGVVLAYDARLFVCLLALEFVIAFVTKYICFVPVSGSMLFLLILLTQVGVWSAISFSPAVVAIINRHMINFKRIRYGIEARFSYLWSKEKEIERIDQNWSNLTEEQRTLFGNETYHKKVSC